MRLGACGFLKETLSPDGRGITVPPTVHSETGESRGKRGGNISPGARLWLPPADYLTKSP